MFALTGYRTATISHFRLGASSDGRLSAIEHRVQEQTSAVREFAEQTATPTRMMYAAPHRRTSHRLAVLDVAVPSWMRAPGEMPGMFAHEVAMDELAEACGLDPIELRRRNEPELDPESGNPFDTRRLLECFDRGAATFGWASRPAGPRSTRQGDWWIGTGVAAATYPAMRKPGNVARVEACGDDRYAVSIGSVDIGTGARTALAQIAADALETDLDSVRLRIGDSALPFAGGAGGSTGLASWGSAIVLTARDVRARLAELGGAVPAEGVVVDGGFDGETPASRTHSMHAFGAHFVEVRVDADTGEVRVPRATSVYAAGRIINARTARSQFLGGFSMGVSMALHEETVADARLGHYANHDLAEYHIATNADIGEIEVSWLEEEDPLVNELGLKGIGEIGITGAAAAVGNAYWHATGLRVRDLPITPDKYFREVSRA
jgi:xanthine dehydrogenase YagR molybdenum-binding subunit